MGIIKDEDVHTGMRERSSLERDLLCSNAPMMPVSSGIIVNIDSEVALAT